MIKQMVVLLCMCNVYVIFFFAQEANYPKKICIFAQYYTDNK